MKTLALILVSLIVTQVQAANTVPDGYYTGTGSWSSSGPNGSFSGPMNIEWTQNGEDSENLGILLMGGQVVQQFNDQYKFIQTSGVHYTMSRKFGSVYSVIGNCTQDTAGYSCHITQSTPNGDLDISETGFMQTSATLVRVGTITAADGTVTTYSGTLVKQ